MTPALAAPAGTVPVRPRPRPISVALAASSVALTLLLVVATDLVVLTLSSEPPLAILVGIVVLNLGCLLQSLVGGLIEWRRPAHRIGRLLLLGGPLYAILAAGWTTAELLEPFVDPTVYRLVNWVGLLFSFPGVALIAGWIPLLFPTGRLPGPRWRVPAGALVVLSGIGLAAWAVRPGPLVEGEADNLFGIPSWPAELQLFIDLIPIELVALFVLAAAALVVRYRRGTIVDRLQIRWFLASVALIVAGFAGVVVEQVVRDDDGPLVSVLVAYTGILAMPMAIGVAVLRYRLYELDRIISRTIGWAVVTGMLLAVFAGTIVGLQAILAQFTANNTLAVAGSTLFAAALFQPLRARVQRTVDLRFNRARVDAQLAIDGFEAHLRDNLELGELHARLLAAIGETVQPSRAGLWIRGAGR